MKTSRFWISLMGVVFLSIGLVSSGCSPLTPYRRTIYQPTWKLVTKKVFYAGEKGNFTILLRPDFPARSKAVPVKIHFYQRANRFQRGRPTTSPVCEKTVHLKGKRTLSLSGTIPDLSPGLYQLQVYLGGRYQWYSVEIKSPLFLHLVTDKPLYQPGQTISMRLLALDRFKKRPYGNEKVTFEVADPRGNTLYREEKKTSTYGIAALRFKLGSEISLGKYTLRARLGEANTAKVVEVKRYQLNRFAIQFQPQKKSYSLGEPFRGLLQVKYVFGRPVRRASVNYQVKISRGKQSRTLNLHTTTDHQGRAPIRFLLPSVKGGDSSWNRLQREETLGAKNIVWSPLAVSCRLEIQCVVRDGAGVVGKKTFRMNLNSSQVVVRVFLETNRVLKNHPNYLYIVTTTSSGEPVATRGVMAVAGEAYRFETDSLGLARMYLPDRAIAKRPTSDDFPDNLYPRNYQNIVVWAWDDQNRRGKVRIRANLNYTSDEVLVARTNRAFYRHGDKIRLDLFSSLSDARGEIFLLSQGRLIDRRSFQMSRGRQAILFPTSRLSDGLYQFHIVSNVKGPLMWDFCPVYIASRPEKGREGSLQLTMKPSRSSYRPGDRARLQFQVRGKDGRGREAALGIFIVDSAVPGIDRVPRSLREIHRYLQSPGFQLKWWREKKPQPGKNPSLAEEIKSAVRRTILRRWLQRHGQSYRY